MLTLEIFWTNCLEVKGDYENHFWYYKSQSFENFSPYSRTVVGLWIERIGQVGGLFYKAPWFISPWAQLVRRRWQITCDYFCLLFWFCSSGVGVFRMRASGESREGAVQIPQVSTNSGTIGGGHISSSTTANKCTDTRCDSCCRSDSSSSWWHLRDDSQHTLTPHDGTRAHVRSVTQCRLRTSLTIVRRSDYLFIFVYIFYLVLINLLYHVFSHLFLFCNFYCTYWIFISFLFCIYMRKKKSLSLRELVEMWQIAINFTKLTCT